MKSTRSCCSVENGSLALGIIGAVLSCKTILGAIIFEVYTMIETSKGEGLGQDMDSFIKDLQKFNLYIFLIFFIIGGIHLMFSVFLINGVLKRNASHVMIYYVYSVIMLILNLLILTVVILLVTHWAVLVLIGVYILIHALFLTMVYKTYKKFKLEGAFQVKHKLLIEN